MLDYFLKYGSILIFIFHHYHQQENIYRNCRVIFLYQSFQPEIFQTYFFQLYCLIKGLISKTWWFVNFWKLHDLWYFQGLVKRILYKGFFIRAFLFFNEWGNSIFNELLRFKLHLWHHTIKFIEVIINKITTFHLLLKTHWRFYRLRFRQ